MTVTMEQVLAELNPEEPDYAQAARLGSDALPHLESLIKGDDPLLASKAAYLVGFVTDPQSINILRAASESGERNVRVAAAAAVANLPRDEAAPLLVDLLADEDVGVRKVALRSVPPQPPAEIREAVRRLAEHETTPALRELRARVMEDDKE